MEVKHSNRYFTQNVVIARLLTATSGDHNTAIGYTTTNKNTAIGKYYW